jgi:hypothetical protein
MRFCGSLTKRAGTPAAAKICLARSSMKPFATPFSK